MSVMVNFAKFSARANKKVLVISSNPSRTIIGYENLKDATLPLQEDFIYLGSVSELPQPEMAGHTNLILLKDQDIDPAFLEKNSLNIALANSQENFDALTEGMKEIFDLQMRINTIGDKLLFMVQDEVEPREILDFGYQILCNPILLLDPSLCLVGSAGAESVSNEPTIEYVLSNGYMPDYYLSEVMKERSESPEDKVLIIWEKSFLEHRMLAGRIMRGTHLLGYLKVFEYNRPFTDFFDYEIIKLICQYLAINMDISPTHYHSDIPHIESFLQDILDKKIVGTEAVDERAQHFNLELRPFKAAVVVEFENTYHRTDKLYLMKQVLQRLLKRNTILVYHNVLVALFDRSTEEGLFDKGQIKELDALMRANGCKAAYSMPFRNLQDFHKCFNQAQACFRISDSLHKSERVLIYSDFMIAHMLLNFGEIFDLNDLIHPTVKTLLKIDEQKGGNLTDTLFAFIDHKMDITATAKALFVHYNTLKYRIQRISEIAGIDYDDESTIFRIELSKRIIKLLDHSSNAEETVA
jgi:hypothetical protein